MKVVPQCAIPAQLTNLVRQSHTTQQFEGLLGQGPATCVCRAVDQADVLAAQSPALCLDELAVKRHYVLALAAHPKIKAHCDAKDTYRGQYKKCVCVRGRMSGALHSAYLTVILVLEEHDIADQHLSKGTHHAEIRDIWLKHHGKELVSACASGHAGM